MYPRPDDEPDENYTGPEDDTWYQSGLEAAAGPPRNTTEYYDDGKLRRRR